VIAVAGKHEHPARRRGAETREAIDAASTELFAELGYHAASMRGIATAAGIQPGAIYHWYGSKEAILVHLQDEFMARLTEDVLEAIHRVTGRPVLRLAAAVRAHVVFHGLHRKEAFVTDSEIRALSTQPRRRLVAKRDEYQQLFTSLIEAGVADGTLRSSDVRVATYSILLACTGVALWFDPDGALSLDRVAQLHVELVLGALQAGADVIAEAITKVTD
jgi:AcrR family transcriptional regulator